ncbi:hypothetical protein HYT51_02900 [Candidatus Woesearchaeota archaeon]|nr:hypothetical protein [Candidatus Woesearchaeota archaeon]
MRFWLNLFVISAIAFLVFSLFGVYSGEAVKKIVKWEDIYKKSHIGGPEGAPSGRCKTDLWCPVFRYTSGYYCMDGSIYRNKTDYRCDTSLQLCIPRETFELIQHCNPDATCIDGISECQSRRLPYCRDSDEGNYRYNLGVTTDSLGTYHEDYCSGNNQLVEGYCSNGVVAYRNISCLCDEGKCL